LFLPFIGSGVVGKWNALKKKGNILLNEGKALLKRGMLYYSLLKRGKGECFTILY